MGVKWLWHEADHLPPYSVEVKDVWSYGAAPPLLCPFAFMVWCLIKHRDTFTLPALNQNFFILYWICQKPYKPSKSEK